MDINETIKILLDALSISGDNAVLHKNAAKLLYDVERFDEATEHFLRALELNESDGEVLKGLAEASFKAGRIEDSLKYLEKAFSKFGEWPYGCMIKARILLRDKEYKGGLEWYEKAVKQDPSLEDDKLRDELSGMGKSRIKVIDFNT